jgi:hypothetical protein
LGTDVPYCKNSDHLERSCYMNPNKRGENSDYPYNDVTENKGEFDLKKTVST